jgi:hypothetical protein
MVHWVTKLLSRTTMTALASARSPAACRRAAGV